MRAGAGSEEPQGPLGRKRGSEFPGREGARELGRWRGLFSLILHLKLGLKFGDAARKRRRSSRGAVVRWCCQEFEITNHVAE